MSVVPFPTRRHYTSGYADRVHTPQVVSRVLRTMMEQYPVHADMLDADPIDFGSIDTLVGTGLSGALIVPQLTRSLQRAGYDVDFLLVRKENDGTHSSYPVEGSLGRRWLFVDDLISSGKTLRRCISRIESVTDRSSLAAVFLYGTGRGGAGRGSATLYPASQYYRDEGDEGAPWEADGWHYETAPWEQWFDEFQAFEMARPRVRDAVRSVA